MKQPREYQLKAIRECMDALCKDDNPVLLMASVGSGKSLMLSEISLIFERLQKRVLCLVNNSELVRSNAATYKEQGGNPSIYSAALKQKSIANPIIFATPQTVLNAIKKNKKISQIKFNLIMVDEAHMINYSDFRTTFMRILRHYKVEYPQMRVLGATGTNFRFQGKPIVGDDCLFQSQVGNITTAWLIENGYLVKPKFEVDVDLTIDFSKVKLNKLGQFSGKQMESVIEKNHRLTGEILERLQYIMESQNRFGCFIFCCTVKHCQEAYHALPKHETAIITGFTPEKERQYILTRARAGEIKYLINVQVLTVGIDVPGYDTLLFLRPTESLVLAVQMIGRVLRLYPNKKEALILDCAGNIERHRDWDDPIIIDAIEQIEEKDGEIEKPFPCPICQTYNSEFARRCIGIINKKRCDYYFVFKECPQCDRENDITARKCRWCECELLDPNRKLNKAVLEPGQIIVPVIDSKYWIVHNEKYTQIRASFDYESELGQRLTIQESFTPTSSEKSKNYFYAVFVKQHCSDASFWYPHLQNYIYLQQLITKFNNPTHLLLGWSGREWSVKKKIFDLSI